MYVIVTVNPVKQIRLLNEVINHLHSTSDQTCKNLLLLFSASRRRSLECDLLIFTIIGNQLNNKYFENWHPSDILVKAYLYVCVCMYAHMWEDFIFLSFIRLSSIYIIYELLWLFPSKQTTWKTSPNYIYLSPKHFWWNLFLELDKFSKIRL